MLVITRRAGEAFYIYPTQDINPSLTVGELFANGPIKIALLESIKRNQTRVGIEAPDAITILREELYESKLA